MPDDNETTETKALEAFLSGLRLTTASDQQQAAIESSYRSLGRCVGCYMQGLLESGLTLSWALHLALALQASIFSRRLDHD